MTSALNETVNGVKPHCCQHHILNEVIGILKNYNIEMVSDFPAVSY